MPPKKTDIVCAVCGHSYASTQTRYHERTCTRTTAEVKYPDPFSDKPGAVTTELLIRDPLDRKFHCIYCVDFDHKDTEAVKNHGRLCKNATSTDRVCIHRGQSKETPALQSTPERNLAPVTPNDTPSDDLRSSPSLVFDVVFPSASVPSATSSPLRSSPPILSNHSGAASVLQDHVKPTAVKRHADEPASSSHPSKRHAPSASSSDFAPDLTGHSSPSNPPLNHASSSQLTLPGSNSSQQSSSSASSLSSSRSQSIHSRTQTIYQTLHLLTSTCTGCFVRGIPMEHAHTVDSCPHHFANSTDPKWCEFRSIFKNIRDACYGCSVPNSIWFVDQMNNDMRLAHRGRQGGNCLFNQTFRQLVYSVFHCDQVRRLFCDSGYNTGNFDQGELDGAKIQRWLVLVGHQNRPLTNLLTMVEFVVSLRGLPVENPEIPAIWVTEHE